MRTAYDLARQPDPVEAVVAVDRLANVRRFDPDLLLNFAVHYRGARGNDRVAAVLAAASPYSCSPMETRLRLVIVNGGLPRPRVQWAVQDLESRTAVWLDLAYPELGIGIEYEGTSTRRRSGCCATPAATPGWWTGTGGSTATRSTRSTASRPASSPSSPGPGSALSR